MRTSSLTTTYSQNAVARNTFLLLALSLLPTVLGSWAGSVIGMHAIVQAHPIMSFLMFLGILFAMMGLVYVTAEHAIGVLFLLMFTFVMGLMLSVSIDAVLALKHGSRAIMMAGLSTAGICVASAIIAQTSSYDFSKLSSILLTALIGIIIISLLNMAFFHLPGMALAISFVSVGLFTVFLIMDVQRVINGGETNYVLATLSIYLDIINIFINLLQIFASLGGDND